MNNAKTVLVVTKDVVLLNIIGGLLKDAYRVIDFTNIQSSLDYIYNSTPDLLIIDIDGDSAAVRILNEMKNDPIFGQLPVLAIFGDNFVIPDWKHLFVDDYLRRSCIEIDLFTKVGLCIHRAKRMVEINPLTRLPGNIAIMKQIQKRLDIREIFAIAYADLDYFKPFNDKYGFSRGDEVLKMLGRLILNIVKNKQQHGSFIGHIGGDDFIFIMAIEHIEETAVEIIDNFRKIIPTFYDAEDRTKGYIESVDREGVKKKFPIMEISIGIAHNKGRGFSHYGEIAEVASEMKKYAKCEGGGCFKTDRRCETEISQKA
jgi:diguanylate cyclase (GGDEF)-like protein